MKLESPLLRASCRLTGPFRWSRQEMGSLGVEEGSRKTGFLEPDHPQIGTETEEGEGLAAVARWGRANLALAVLAGEHYDE